MTLPENPRHRRFWHRIRRAALLSAVACAATIGGASRLAAQTQPDAGMLRYPDIGKDHIVFSYANDLWLVSKAGGSATPLASPAGSELFPRFSPDGQTIAFVGNYDGNRDLYTIATAGGPAERVTYHPSSESLCDWTADGKLLYSTNGFSGLGRQSQLFTRALNHPIAEQVGVPYGTNGAISGDGVWLAYTPHSRDTRTWKRYMGGMASDIWLFNLNNNTSKQITDWEGTDSLPMWHEQTVYYLSDQGDAHKLNIWAYDTATGARRQVTKFTEFDCKWPSIGPGSDGQGEIVLQNGSSLYVVDLASGEAQAVTVTIPGDRPKLRPQRIDASEFISGGDISPNAKRLAVQARGDIWTAPVESGTPRNLTRSSNAAERSPSWSPDGRWIAYFSDLTGEYELYVTQSDGRGETKRLTQDGNCFRYSPIWSPDSKHIFFSDKTGAMWLHTLESNETKHLDTNPFAGPTGVSWSKDSRYITYARPLDQDGASSCVFICDVGSGEVHQVTSSHFGESSPAFDRAGDYLYFFSNRQFSSPKYEDLGTTFIYAGTEVLVALPLRKDVKNPLLPTSDEETWEEEKEDEGEESSDDAGDSSDDSGDAAEDAGGDDGESPSDQAGDASDDEDKDEEGDDKSEEAKDDLVEIDFEDMERRAFQLPVSAGNFGGLLVTDKGHLVYMRMPSRGMQGTPSIKIFDPTKNDAEEQTVADGAFVVAWTDKGDKLVVSRGGTYYVISAAPGQKLEKAVSTDGMDIAVNPREEWKQMFHEAWRIQRDFFYDPTMHGVDWDAVRERYSRMLADCASREDVGFVIGEMIAEINVGHAYYRPAGGESEPSVAIGTLGCTFELVDGAFQIARLFEGAVWDLDARNPLRAVGVEAGEFLLAVNGIPMDVETDPYAALQGMSGKVVTLTVSDAAKGGEEREVVVRIPASDSNMRYRAWIEANRQHVAERTDGKVGYIYVPNTGINGQDDLVRQFYGQLDKQALIIDDRWNGGGQIPTRFIELLNRPVTNYWARRDGRDWTWPPDSHQGPKCMLINGMAGSGGDMFPALFKQSGLGKLIGMRTWGGLVGISGNPGLIDGAGVTAPTFAYYEKDGTWGIEGHGVDPDIEVIDDPAKMVNGGDPQLDAAIDHMLEELARNPYVKPDRPAYPDRSGMGIAEEDK